jgi:hypothetical protein
VSVTIVRELDGFRGDACLVQDEETKRYFVVSSVDTSKMFGFMTDGGFETLVFAADKDGTVTDWSDVAGGRGLSRIEAIADLTLWLRSGAKSRWEWDEEDDAG